jgi:hypothetical protein
MRRAGRKHVAGLEAVYKVRHMQYLFHFSSAFYDIVVKNYSNTQTSIPHVNSNNTFLKYCIKKRLCAVTMNHTEQLPMFFEEKGRYVIG